MEFLKNKRFQAACLILFFLIGFWLTFVRPVQLANKEYARTQESIKLANNYESFLEGQLTGMSWFKNEYSNDLRVFIDQTKKSLIDLESDLVKAREANPKDKKLLSEKVNKSLEGLMTQMKKSQEKLVSYHEKKDNARKIFQQFTEITVNMKKRQKDISEELEKEKENYLSKYVKEMANNLSLADKIINQAFELMGQVGILLPSETDATFSGDPLKAISIFYEVGKLTDNSKGLIKAVNDELILQKDALTEAQPSVISASEKLEKAREYLEITVKKTALLPDKALREAFEKKSQAEKILEEAGSALIVKVENGKCDLVLAYKKALEVFALTDQIIKEADKQIKMLADSKKLIQQLRLKIGTVSAEMDNSARSQQVLEAHHSISAYEEVSGNTYVSEGIIDSSRKMLSKSESLFQDQKFSEISNVNKKSFLELERASKLLANLRSHADKLERYREEWPRVEKQAKETISEEEDAVEKYGRHSSSAQSDFDDAVVALKKAQSFASKRDFVSAVKKAKEANDLAEGTGHRAYTAYEDSQRPSTFSTSSDDYGSPSNGGGNDGGGYDSGPSGGGDGGGYDSGPSGGGDGGGFE